MLKRFDELTHEQQTRVLVMYSDKSTVTQFLYNFDEHGNYHGRQYAPPVGTVHAEPAEENASAKKMLEKVEVKTDEKPRRTRRAKKE